MNDSSNRIKLVKALEGGRGIQYILDEANKILGNPVMLLNIEYKSLAHTKHVVTDDWIWNELITNGRFCEETIRFFRDECFIDACANAKTVTFMISDKLKYDRILGKIFNKDNVMVASVIVVACDKPFEDNDPEILEAICEILSKEIGKSKFYQIYGRKQQGILINELIGGKIEDKALFSAHLAIVYDGLKNNIFIAVADISKCDPEYTRLEYFCDLFKNTQPEFKFSIYNNYIVIIISSDDVMLNVKKDLSKLDRLFRKHNIYAGISSGFENLFESSRYYEEAVETLNNKDRSETDAGYIFVS